MSINLTGVLVPLGLFASVVLIIYFIYSYRHKERMEMLKMGLTPNIGLGYQRGLISLWIGIVAICAGLGLLISLIFEYDAERVTSGIISIFVGTGLLIYYQKTAPHREQKMRLHEAYITSLRQHMEGSIKDADLGEERDMA